jgi:hypothetical protein
MIKLTASYLSNTKTIWKAEAETDRDVLARLISMRRWALDMKRDIAVTVVYTDGRVTSHRYYGKVG